LKTAYHIAIEGAIGVGKTSLAKLVAKKYNTKVILEQFEDNPFLSKFYEDRSQYAFQTQLWFLMERYKQQQGLEQMDLFSSYMISDYMFVKDRLFASLNLNDDEMQLYDKVASALEENILYPDLVIFLQADTRQLISNIAKRGREYEKNIDWNYIESLNAMYNEYFFRYDKSPLLIINSNDLDFVNNNEDLNLIFEFISKPDKGTRYFNPIKDLG
tara:strand:- start:16 stop:660 length:645 start_codon:yes stop_codon:yes gene_type:complete